MINILSHTHGPVFGHLKRLSQLIGYSGRTKISRLTSSWWLAPQSWWDPRSSLCIQRDCLHRKSQITSPGLQAFLMQAHAISDKDTDCSLLLAISMGHPCPRIKRPWHCTENKETCRTLSLVLFQVSKWFCQVVGQSGFRVKRGEEGQRRGEVCDGSDKNCCAYQRCEQGVTSSWSNRNLI